MYVGMYVQVLKSFDTKNIKNCTVIRKDGVRNCTQRILVVQVRKKNFKHAL